MGWMSNPSRLGSYEIIRILEFLYLGLTELVVESGVPAPLLKIEPASRKMGSLSSSFLGDTRSIDPPDKDFLT